MQAPLDRADGDAQGPGDLREGTLFDVVEHEQQSIVFPQSGERPPDGLGRGSWRHADTTASCVASAASARLPTIE
jgi:hypothetical protein